MFRTPYIKNVNAINRVGLWDTVALGFDGDASNEFETIAAAATFNGNGVEANGINQFTLWCYINGAAGNSVARIFVKNAINHNWKPTAAAERNVTQQFDLVNGTIVRNTHLAFTFGIYSNTTLDLQASGGLQYFSVSIHVENTDTVSQEFTFWMQAQAWQGNKFTEQVL